MKIDITIIQQINPLFTKLNSLKLQDMKNIFVDESLANHLYSKFINNYKKNGQTFYSGLDDVNRKILISWLNTTYKQNLTFEQFESVFNFYLTFTNNFNLETSIELFGKNDGNNIWKLYGSMDNFSYLIKLLQTEFIAKIVDWYNKLQTQ